ncbi:hypothetical protein ABIE41_000128 [Bosea sp. OAE506]|uniref:hypothetical protein n=1 Tax=Bosea sp. OAE506 TaxID=2663870 RepID=UPI00178C0158
MTSNLSEKAFQFAVSAPCSTVKQKFLVDGSSEPIAERRLRRELPANATVDFQRAANSDDIRRTNLMAGGMVRLS